MPQPTRLSLAVALLLAISLLFLLTALSARADGPPVYLPQWGKGVVFLNGFNLGRYWNIGPQLSLYAPAPLFQKGKNKIIIFEEEKPGSEIKFIDHLKMS